MKRTYFLTIVFLLVFMMPSQSLAYDYRDDTLSNAEQTAMNALNDRILSGLHYLAGDNDAQTYSQRIDWNQAKKVFVFTPSQYFNVLQSGKWEDAFVSDAIVNWKVPISSDDQGHVYVITGDPSSDELSYVIASAGKDVLNQAEYLYLEEPIPADVDTENASLYITSVPRYGVDFITVIKNDSVTLVPFSTRPDLLRLHNGEAYTPEEIYTALYSYSLETAETAESSTIASGGGDTSNATLSGMEIAVSLLIATVVTIRFYKKKSARMST